MTYLITPVILLTDTVSKTDYEHLQDVDLGNCKIVLVGTVSQYKNFLETFQNVFTPQHCFCSTEDAGWYKDFFSKITTPFWVVATPFELWGQQFIEHTSANIEKYLDSSTQLIYLLGFLSHNAEEVYYSQLVTPNLTKTLQLRELFQTTSWFHPLVKVVFSSAVTERLDILPSAEPTWWSGYQSFVVHYLSALYVLSDYNEPQIDYYPGSFLIPKIEEPKKEELEIVRATILEKEEVWQTNIWSKVYWGSLWFSRKHSYKK